MWSPSSSSSSSGGQQVGLCDHGEAARLRRPRVHPLRRVHWTVILIFVHFVSVCLFNLFVLQGLHGQCLSTAEPSAAWSLWTQICLKVSGSIYQAFQKNMFPTNLSQNIKTYPPSGDLILRSVGSTSTDPWKSSSTSKLSLDKIFYFKILFKVLDRALLVPGRDLLRHRRLPTRGRSHSLPLLLAGENFF